MDEEHVTYLVCRRCGHRWLPRHLTPPRVCPNTKCHSAYWDQVRPNQDADGSTPAAPVRAGAKANQAAEALS